MAASVPWSTNPGSVIEAAKNRAKEALSDEAPRLTALERAFWLKYKLLEES